MLRLAEQLDDCIWLRAKYQEPSMIVFSTGNGEEFAFQSSKARTIMRLLCARLVGLATESGCNAINPYQGHFPLTVSSQKGGAMALRAEYTNTPRIHEFRLDLQ